MRAAIYCRISHDPRGESLGVTRQLEDCTKLAEDAGWEVAEVYTDNDTSATSGKPRPEYRRMLGDVEAGRVGAIIAWHVDRLYRKLDDLQDLIKVVEGNGAVVRTVKAGDFDLATATGRGIARILGSVASMEGEQKSERWKRSWRQRREMGRVTPAGWRTFGYTRDGEVVEAEADRLRAVFVDVLAGKSIRSICGDLNTEGWRTTRDGDWTNTGLRHLLRNPRVAGYATYKGSIVGDGDWPRIIDRDTWRTVVAMLDGRTRPHHPRRWLLVGLLYCGECGAQLHSRAGKGYQAYTCVTALGGCGGVNGATHHIDALVESFARRRLADGRVRRRLAELRSGGSGHLLAEMDALQERLAQIDDQLAEPGRSMTALLRASDTIRDRIDELQAQLPTAGGAPIPVGDEWPEDLHTRRRLIELVVDRVWLDRAARRGRFDPERVRIDPA